MASMEFSGNFRISSTQSPSISRWLILPHLLHLFVIEDHSTPISVPFPTITSFRIDPPHKSPAPNLILLRFLGTQRKFIKHLCELRALGAILNNENSRGL